MTDPERTLLLAVARGLRELFNAAAFSPINSVTKVRDEITAALKPFDEEAKVHSKRERWDKRDKA